MATDDAYMRAIRALNWRTQQLRAYGIQPWDISPDFPQYPPEQFDFGVPDDVVYLRMVDPGTDDECWVVCAKGDPNAVPFWPNGGMV